MKKLILVSIGVLALTVVSGLQSCSKVASLLQYDLTLQSGSVTVSIPASADTAVDVTGAGVNNINIDSFIKDKTANQLGVSNITSVKITAATLTLVNGVTGNDFANFKSCSGSFYSNSNTTPYVLAIANNPDVSTSILNLPVDASAELKGYLTGTQYNYGFTGMLRRATTIDLTCKIDFTYTIHVQG